MALGVKCYLPDYIKVVDREVIKDAEWIDMLGVSYLTVEWDTSGIVWPSTYSTTTDIVVLGRNCEDGDGEQIAASVSISVYPASRGLYKVAPTVAWPRYVKVTVSTNTFTSPTVSGTFRLHVFGQ